MAASISLTVLILRLYLLCGSPASPARLSRIRQYLGYRPFDHAVQERLTHWLEARATEGPLPQDFLRRAEDQLRAWRVVLPVHSTIERLVASAAAGAQQQIFKRIIRELPLQLKQEIDELLEAPDSDNRSKLFRPSAPVILKYIERYQLIEEIVANRITLGGIDPRLVDYFAQLAKRYDAQALKRFTSAKRYALVASFLVETRKTLLDHVVEMHDQYLIADGIRKKKETGSETAVSDNPLFERVAEVAEDSEDSHLTLDVGVCLRADCAPNECQRPLSAHKRSDNPGLA